MAKSYHQKGFTLVELAIVMVIIGLLIGGVLKGQEILKQAKVSSTITTIGAIDAATQSFYSTYSALPGDLPQAHERLTDCAECGDATALATLGDLAIGDPNWDMTAFQSASFTGPVAVTPDKETVLFWLELSKAGLLSGITKDGVTGVAASFGGSLPVAKLGGGFIVGQANPVASIPGRHTVLTSNDVPQRGSDGFFIKSAYAWTSFSIPSAPPGLAYNMPDGPVLALIPRPAALNAFASGEYALTPGDALQMDTKMDDSLPHTGNVQAFGVTASCYAGAPAYRYDGAVTKKNCGIYARIMKN